MGSRHASGWLFGIVPTASLLALAACSSVLGIQELHQGPAPGSAGESSAGGTNPSTGGGSAGDSQGGTSPAGGTGASAGSTPANGGASAGGAATGGLGGAGLGGGANAGGGANVGGSANAGGSANVGGSAGAAAAAGAGGGTTVSSTVIGTVIDFRGRKIPNLPVQIGDALTTTDEQGSFTVENVPAEYDVSLTVDLTGDYARETYSWVYQGLTRRNPTLQVYVGLVRREGNITVIPSHAAPNDSTKLEVALGGPDGSAALDDVAAVGVQTTTNWRGPATTQERVHGLLWQFDATTELPIKYLGYDSNTINLADTADMPTVNLDLSATATITQGTVGGTVKPASGTSRENNVFLRFTSQANLPLARDTTGPNTFSYVVPGIANSSVTVAASEGDTDVSEYAVAHADGLSPGSAAVALTIPKPASPLTPADGAVNVDANTQFTFTAPTGSAGTFLVTITDNANSQGLYIVTTKKTVKLPAVPGGTYALASTHQYTWQVETHGSFATVDDLAKSDGFLDEFSGNSGIPVGPNNTSGSYTVSVGNGFTAK